MKEILINYVDDLLQRYTDDETGQEQKQTYLDMTDTDKLRLILFTLQVSINKMDVCPSKEDIDDMLDDLDIDILVRFDYGSY